VLVALAGRQPPELAWRFDLSWAGTLLVHGLDDLAPSEAEQLLESRGVPTDVRQSVLAFAGGHPQTLAMAADAARRCDSATSSGRLADQVLRALVAELIETAPSPDHRMALRVCAHADTTSEQLLGAVLPSDDTAHADPAELYAWLRTHRFIKSGSAGLYPHDTTVRKTLDNHLRSRDPAAYEDMRHKIAEFARGSLPARASALSRPAPDARAAGRDQPRGR
jgi:hypothetical protein